MKKSPASASAISEAAPSSQEDLPTDFNFVGIAVGEVIRIRSYRSFVILSFGRKLGAVADQTLRIMRRAQPAGRIILKQITNDFSIAHILSFTNTGSSLSVPDIQIGDSAHLE
ncbi:MAG: hypothetical protein CMI18_03085 [Opitutaceae bacterium]|nr:hypothetical protein [Opitutaceae bacterium]